MDHEYIKRSPIKGGLFHWQMNFSSPIVNSQLVSKCSQLHERHQMKLQFQFSALHQQFFYAAFASYKKQLHLYDLKILHDNCHRNLNERTEPYTLCIPLRTTLETDDAPSKMLTHQLLQPDTISTKTQNQIHYRSVKGKTHKIKYMLRRLGKGQF